MGIYRYIKAKTTAGAKRTGSAAGKVVNAAEIAETASATREMLAEFWATRKGTGRCETFQNAVVRRGLTEDDLRALHRQHSIVAHATLVFFVMAAALGTWHGLQGSQAGAMAGLGASLAMAGYFIRAAFRAAQIQRRELFAFPVFLRQPLDWLPAWTLPAVRSTTPAKRQVRHER